jgi:hypothetical protein
LANRLVDGVSPARGGVWNGRLSALKLGSYQVGCPTNRISGCTKACFRIHED